MSRGKHHTRRKRSDQLNAKDGVLPVSVVIPTYNGERYIDEALRSVFAQTRLPGEIIVVDDASTDSTTRRIEEIATAAPVPVKLIRLSQNSGGPPRPMNVGIEAARSPLIAVLDQDDVFLPQKIENQAAALSAHPEVAFVFGDIDVKQKPNMPTAIAFPEKQFRHLRKHMVSQGDFVSCDGLLALRVLLNHGNCVGGFPGFTFRRDDWQRVGGLDERLAAAADYDLLCRLCQRGQVARVPEVHYLFRFHNGNLSRSQILCQTDEIETRAKYADCGAWPAAASEVRQAIGKNLYALAVLLGVSGFRSAARRLLTTSLLLGGLHPYSLLRAANYPIKVFRRRRRTGHAPISSAELARAVRSSNTISRLYGRRWWPLWLERAGPLETIRPPAVDATPRAPEERHAA
jgi:glycosyltransferase involved in cell wall biosynthesis